MFYIFRDFFAPVKSCLFWLVGVDFLSSYPYAFVAGFLFRNVSCIFYFNILFHTAIWIKAFHYDTFFFFFFIHAAALHLLVLLSFGDSERKNENYDFFCCCSMTEASEMNAADSHFFSLDFFSLVLMQAKSAFVYEVHVKCECESIAKIFTHRELPK